MASLPLPEIRREPIRCLPRRHGDSCLHIMQVVILMPSTKLCSGYGGRRASITITSECFRCNICSHVSGYHLVKRAMMELALVERTVRLNRTVESALPTVPPQKKLICSGTQLCSRHHITNSCDSHIGENSLFLLHPNPGSVV